MRVLHIGKFYPPYPGGIENFSASLARELTTNQVKCAILAHAPPGTHHTRHFDDNGVDVTLVACHGQYVYAPISPTFVWHLARTIQRFQPDLLHLHLPNTSAFWALLSPRARCLPWVVHWHADVPLDAAERGLRLAYRLYRPWEQAVLRHAQSIIATSTAYLDSSPALAPWRDKVRVIPLGLDTAPQSPSQLSPLTSVVWPESIDAPTALRILSVGRLAYYKGHDVLLRALAHVPEASLLLVGSGERESALKQLAQDLGITPRVSFAGMIDDIELAAAYASADVFCLPSIERTEAFGLVLLEAMRASLPIFASAIPGSGMGYVIQDGETGLLLPPGDVAAFVEAMTRLLRDRALRTRLGDAGHRRWSDHFSMTAVTSQIQALYQTVLEPK